MLAHKIIIIVTLLLASYNVVAQDCNSTTGFITNRADFPTTDLVFVNYTAYTSWGDATGPALFNFTDQISIEFPDGNSQFYGGGWGLNSNGDVNEYISGINYPGSYSILFSKPAFYFATRVNYSPDVIAGSGYPVMTFYNSANESVACYDLETIDPIRTNGTGELIFRGFYNAQGFSKVTFEGAYIVNADILVRFTAPQAPVAPVASPVAIVNSPVNSPVATPVVASPKSPVAKSSSAALMMALSALPFIAAVLY